MQRHNEQDKDCRVGINYKWSKIRNAKTKYEVKIQMLWSMAGWKSMDLGFLPETSQTTVLSFV